MKIIYNQFSPLGLPSNHGGIQRCRKPLKKRDKTMAEITDGKLMDRAWEVNKGPYVELMTFRKRDKMSKAMQKRVKARLEMPVKRRIDRLRWAYEFDTRSWSEV